MSCYTQYLFELNMTNSTRSLKESSSVYRLMNSIMSENLPTPPGIRRGDCPNTIITYHKIEICWREVY
uniref:Uncharacterized protein n=1 Tax=Arion vulgaris TaxID=1028688 RepID=A0A0B7AI86_9EUPU